MRFSPFFKENFRPSPYLLPSRRAPYNRAAIIASTGINRWNLVSKQDGSGFRRQRWARSSHCPRAWLLKAPKSRLPVPNPPRLKKPGQRSRLSAAKSIGLAWDLADLTVIDANVSSIESQLGPVDILINNTGGPPPTTAAGQDPALWLKQFQSMVLSVIAITDRVLPSMRQRHWGRIITSTSSGVVAPIPNLGHLQRSASLARRLVQDPLARSRQGRHHRKHHSSRPHRHRSPKISRRIQSQARRPHRGRSRSGKRRHHPHRPLRQA